MENELSIAFIGAGRRTPATALRAAARVCAVRDVHVIDINEQARRAGQGRQTAGVGISGAPRAHAGWLFAGATRNIEDVVAWRRQTPRVDAKTTRMATAGRAGGAIEAGRK
ncbi:MAG TPA: hypothetical protein DCR74_02150 [Achromobacter sp.]|nr:hypothetical protein [Achromobacter sp.]